MLFLPTSVGYSENVNFGFVTVYRGLLHNIYNAHGTSSFMHPLGLFKRSSGSRNGGALIVEFPRFRTILFEMFTIVIALSECGEFSRICFFMNGRIPVRTPHPEKSPKIGFLSILVRFPLKSESYQASIRCWAISEMPFKWCFAGCPMMARL